MSNVEREPVSRHGTRGPEAAEPALRRVEILTPRDVPLGGPRSMSVRRTLPQRARSFVGAWCFVDHYGPDDVALRGGMDLPPHPHTGLQTVTWLFDGEVEHRDSLGSHAFVRPGEINLMTGGRGICHSEVSTARTTVLHGVQLWVALPGEHREAERDFQRYVPSPIRKDGAEIKVFLGSLLDAVSPVRTFTPLLGAELILEAGASLTLSVDAAFEHGLLVDEGDIELDGTALSPAQLGFLPSGNGSLTVRNTSSARARVILLGGPPFEEEIVMWWNFIGRSHDDIVRARKDWEESSERFGAVEGYAGERLPAPELPNATLAPRRNPPTS
ncbi:pirin family protein [Streptomyces sp. 43Y-GA-1]|uniref:pirin family protein n=1 Tax=Streptomyces sp. 43Y-GA-1 TaxID=2939435 RepID=UPI0020BEEFD9|nr:pirin family protein [Streptomyces sp. 43Y-GA-1]MCL6289488.1 pirin family protein [Streptomyces sp. 43Y-GA-1]